MSYIGELTSVEESIFNEAREIFLELLDDFRKRNLLRKGAPQEQRLRLAQMWKQSYHLGLAYNKIVNLFKDEEKVKSFASRNRDFGFTENIMAYSYYNQMIGIFIINIETILRTSLLFFLNEKQGLKKRMEIGRLIRTIKKISPQIGRKLEKIVDTNLRNVLAHGGILFAPEGNVYLMKNAHLENPDKISLVEFVIRVKKQNIVAHAFIDVLMEKVRSGYFRA